ncbi:MAG TPA: thermonuclease family protein, partial [Vineibacter sp.]|nr:thermonuclease family protein [Vineibacter sp.]
VIGGQAVRLMGVHAPERHEDGGAAARSWMTATALGQAVVCRREGRRSFDRVVAVCFNDAGDLAAQLVAAGLGRDCPRFSRLRYASLETEANRRLALPAYCQPRPSAR